jgi:hypothetical protein
MARHGCSRASPVGVCTRACVRSEWYFGVDNLCRDMFLRGYFDEEGWVPLAFICNFPSVAR